MWWNIQRKLKTQMKNKMIITVNIKYRRFQKKIASRMLVISDQEPISMVDIRNMIVSGRRLDSLKLFDDIIITESESNDEIDFDFMKLFNMKIFGRTTRSTGVNKPSCSQFDIEDYDNTIREELNIIVTSRNGPKALKRMREDDNDCIPEKKLKYDANVALLDANPFEIRDIVNEILGFIRSPVTQWDSKEKFRGAIHQDALCTRNINKTFRESYFRGDVKLLDNSWLMRRVDARYQIIPEMRSIHFDCIDVFVTNIAFMQIVLGSCEDKGYITKYSGIHFGAIKTMRVSHQRITRSASTIQKIGKCSHCLVKSNHHESYGTICNFIKKHTNQKKRHMNIINTKYEPSTFTKYYSGAFKTCISE